MLSISFLIVLFLGSCGAACDPRGVSKCADGPSRMIYFEILSLFLVIELNCYHMHDNTCFFVFF